MKALVKRRCTVANGLEAIIGYERLLLDALEGEAAPCVLPEVKYFTGKEGITFPVLFCHERTNRPFRVYQTQTREDCPFCSNVAGRLTSPIVVRGMQWLAASWPIKAYHGICYPPEHRASILAEDICKLGAFVDITGDAVACINMRGSGASVPDHFHAQLHDCALLSNSGTEPKAEAFPLLKCESELVALRGELALYRLPTYPAYILVLRGPWELLGRWLITYLAASNIRPHNFVLAPHGRLVVIPRGLEKAPRQENRYGASEMLGLVAPVTYGAYCEIQNADIITESLRLCGLQDHRDQLAVEEHAIWVMEYLTK